MVTAHSFDGVVYCIGVLKSEIYTYSRFYYKGLHFRWLDKGFLLMEIDVSFHYLHLSLSWELGSSPLVIISVLTALVVEHGSQNANRRKLTKIGVGFWQ